MLQHKVNHCRRLLIVVRNKSNIPAAGNYNANHSTGTEPNNSSKAGVSNDDDSTDALTARFTQLLQDQIESNPNLINKLNEESKYSQKYSPQLTYLKLEPLLKFNKHGKDLASSRPWTGQETNSDANLRMLVDSLPKPKKIQHQGKRLLNAKETSLDYKVNKDAPYEPNGITNEFQKQVNSVSGTTNHNDQMRELYKEKLLGPSVLINSASPSVTLGLANSLADHKINSSIDPKTGRFYNDTNMEKVRGKPLSKDHLANSNDTLYFVTRLFNDQEVLPPWIENQKLLQHDLQGFRNNLTQMFVKFCKDNDYQKFTKPQLLLKFKERYISYANEKVKAINHSIRDYNLQAPSSNLHKSKLLVDEEFKSCVDRNYYQLPELIKQFGEKRKLIPIANTKQGFASLFDKSKVVSQRPVEKVNVWSSFKQMFSELKQT